MPANITLWFLHGGELDVDANSTVTINGPVVAGLHLIFTGNGDVSFGPGRVKEVYPQWWGATGDGTADDTTAIQSALSAGGRVFMPDGTYKITSGLTVSSDVVLAGQSRENTIIKKYGNFVGIVVSSADPDNLNVYMSDFAITSNGSPDASQGMTLTCGRSVFRRLEVSYQGSHGIGFNRGNLCTFEDLILVNNSGDGFRADGNNTNACVFKNIDARSNTGWGINLENSNSNFGLGLTAQHNTAGGVRINDGLNQLFIYAENNTGNNIQIDDGSSHPGGCFGNVVFVASSGTVVVDNSSGYHNIFDGNIYPGYNLVRKNSKETMPWSQTFASYSGNIFFRDPNGANKTFNPRGSFEMGMEVLLINTADNPNEIIYFDSNGLNEPVNTGQRGYFVYDGTNWLKVSVTN